jgi:hypothetical protein
MVQKKSYTVNSIGAATADGATIASLIPALAGQKIRFRAYQGNGAARNFNVEFTVSKAAKNSLNALTEKVAVIVDGSTTSITSSGVTIVPTNETKDTHGAHSAGVFTAPYSSYYNVSMYLQGSSTAYNAGDSFSAYVEVNAVIVPLGATRVQVIGTHNLIASGTQTVWANAGETIVFKGISSQTTTAGSFQGSIIRI